MSIVRKNRRSMDNSLLYKLDIKNFWLQSASCYGWSEPFLKIKRWHMDEQFVLFLVCMLVPQIPAYKGSDSITCFFWPSLIWTVLQCDSTLTDVLTDTNRSHIFSPQSLCWYGFCQHTFSCPLSLSSYPFYSWNPMSSKNVEPWVRAHRYSAFVFLKVSCTLHGTQ